MKSLQDCIKALRSQAKAHSKRKRVDIIDEIGQNDLLDELSEDACELEEIADFLFELDKKETVKGVGKAAEKPAALGSALQEKGSEWTKEEIDTFHEEEDEAEAQRRNRITCEEDEEKAERERLEEENERELEDEEGEKSPSFLDYVILKIDADLKPAGEGAAEGVNFLYGCWCKTVGGGQGGDGFGCGGPASTYQEAEKSLNDFIAQAKKNMQDKYKRNIRVQVKLENLCEKQATLFGTISTPAVKERLEAGTTAEVA